MSLSNVDLRLFAAIADRGSLSAAARHLGVQKSTVSRELARLEARIGHRLVERTSRQARLTDAGRLLLVHAHRVMAEIEAAHAAFEAMSSEPAGRLTVSLPHAVAHKLVVPLLPAFLARYPRIDVALDLSVRNVDLVSEGIDLAIRVGDLAASSLVARKLGHLPIVLVATPACLARTGAPRSVADLAHLDTVALGTAAKAHPWTFDGPTGASSVTVHPRVTASEVALVRDLAVAGLGIATLPQAFVVDDLANGTLVRVLPEVTRGAPAIHAVYPSRRSLTPKASAFIDAVAASLAGART